MIDLEKTRREYMERRGELSLLRERHASQLQEFSDFLRQVNQGGPVVHLWAKRSPTLCRKGSRLRIASSR